MVKLIYRENKRIHLWISSIVLFCFLCLANFSNSETLPQLLTNPTCLALRFGFSFICRGRSLFSTTNTYTSIRTFIQTIDLSTKTLTNDVKTSAPFRYLNVRKRALVAVESYNEDRRSWNRFPLLACLWQR